MKYRPELGLWGNVKIALEEITKTNNSVSVERSDRQDADTENREALEQALEGADETAISLYEAQEAQEVINAQQDEALMELYEMKY